MTIILLCAGVFIFFVGFVTGGGWQSARDEKEIEKLKEDHIKRIAFQSKNNLYAS